MTDDNTIWQLTACIYSGRENPRWVIDASQQQDWMKLWLQAEPSDTTVVQPSILGYTGLRLKCNNHSHWFLYNGCVSFFEKEKIVSKKDSEKQMELFLLNTAPADVKEALQEMKVL